jgi:NAD(P)-dependent dehydrogenase (short-subunit alcohol dehydrogenase family)
MNLGLAGKVALVTGGAHGIGAGIVQALTDEGAEVVYTSRQQHDDTRAIQWHPYDSQTTLMLLVKSHTGQLPDIVVNNNGNTLGVTNPYCSPEEWRAILDLNLVSAVNLSNACIPYMKEKGWGRIVNIASIASLENSGPVPYCVAKAALAAYTHSMGRVLATECPGIVMSAVCPGVIKTSGGHWDNAAHAEKYLNERVPTKRFQTIEEVTGVVAFYCSQQAAACHGAIVGADQGQSRHYSPQVYL